MFWSQSGPAAEPCPDCSVTLEAGSFFCYLVHQLEHIIRNCSGSSADHQVYPPQLAIQGPKVNYSLVMDPENLGQNSPSPHPILSTQMLIIFYMYYIRICVSIAALRKPGSHHYWTYTCCGVTRSFLMRIHHLPLCSGFWVWQPAQFRKLVQR